MSVERLAHVLRYSRAKGTDKLVLLGMANHDGDGGCWPSIETLAKYANISERSVQRAINRLVELGEVSVVYNDGGTRFTRPDRRTNRYVITVEPTAEPTPERGDNGVTHTSPRKTERGDTGDANGVTPASPEPSLEPSITTYPPVVPPQPEFDDFWRVYPLKVSKGQARKAWEKARKKLLPENIIAAAARYRDDPNREDEYTAYPATWLNAERWDDQPLPTRTRNIGPVEMFAVAANQSANPFLELEANQ